ncbi:MAG TPA: fructose-6-phosphate aldolase [Candidatus Polarisedimenticolia bacterium]|nr:fructose-6-phosphate aldolase [Candidatus Polarisedimenticolia bacterium]
MKFFLDTGSVQEIREAAATGILDGVTTNPSLVAKEGKDFKSLLLEICSIVDGPVSAEVTAVDAEGMVRQAFELREIHKNIVVKLPLLKEGIKALSRIAPQGVKVNVTLCFSPAQALIAAKAGATYISPFIGRLDDISHIGMDLIRQIRAIYDNYDFKTQILTASVRHPVHVVEAALAGSDVATIPYKVFEALFNHPLTDIGNEKFLADWKKLKA